MDLLNYSTHCLQSWKDSDLQQQLNLGGIFTCLEKALTNAPKFILPEGGRPIDEKSVYRLFTDLKIPFPCVALEFRSSGVIADSETPSSKRISLVWDLKREVPEFLIGQEIPANGFAIQSISYMDSYDMWVPILGIVIVDLDQSVQRDKPNSVKDSEYLQLVQHRIKNLDMKTENFKTEVFLFSEDMVDQYGREHATNLVLADSGDEIHAALNFAALTTCGNVSSDVIKASAALNKKRLKSGKVEMFDVRVLVVAESGYKSTPSIQGQLGGGHASPKSHLRRGHIRHLPGGNTWVNAAVVNAERHTESAVDVPVYSLQRERPRG